MTDGWGMLWWAFIIKVSICLVAINIIAILILFCFTHRIRKHINKYPVFFCLGSILGNFFGSVSGYLLGRALDAIISNSIIIDFGDLYLILYLFYLFLASIIFTSPTFVILLLIVYYKNSYSSTIPSSKARVFTFGFLFFSILCFIVFFIIRII